jgi:hypothetical protein
MTAGVIEMRLDLFPAHLVLNPDSETPTIWRTTRLIVGRDEIWAWEHDRFGQVQLVLNDRYESVTGRRTTGWTATLSTGDSLYFNRASGCGCGNPLRGWSPPFSTVQIESL